MKGVDNTSKELTGWFGMAENMTDIIRKHCCNWLGDLARIDNSRTPKQLLCSELVILHMF